jgi:pyruvate/2-oxoglutarate dehydrogenase complex dihydrolipoamide acyltransferase (E2) component
MGLISFFKNLLNRNKEVIETKKELVKEEPRVEAKKVEKKEPKVVEEKVTAKEIKSAVKTSKPKKEPKFKASKAAIKLAKENGIDLTKVKGTGKEGSITINDVQKLIG